MSRDGTLIELVVETEGEPQRRFPLRTENVVLGRATGCEILIRHESLSRRHARFVVDAKGIRVEDMGSLNGTYVNGKRASGQVVVTEKDELSIGELKARIEMTTRDAPASGGAWLRVDSSQHRGRVLALESAGVVIGRARTTDLPLPHGTISRKHARFYHDAGLGSWAVEDLGSANGTYVDGVLVSKSQLVQGQKVRLGDVDCVFFDREKPAGRRSHGATALVIFLLFLTIGLVAASLIYALAD